ncbi:MAG: S9 family peptidase [Opitutae bacterium]|nr:S9 family peptidase [Opitutae bacterium]
MRIVVWCTLLAAVVPAAAGAAWKYPAAQKSDQTDDYFGTKIADPYRGLEDLDSPETRAWVQAENALTDSVVGAMPERDAVRKRLTELWNYPRVGLPSKEAGLYFFTRNDGLQNQSPLFVQPGLQGTPRVLIDPNTLAADGTVALTAVAPSPDGKYLGYGLARAGSDWNEFLVRDVATGKDTADVVRWVKFSGLSWTDDSKGFFYARYPEPKEGDQVFGKLAGRQLYYHALGTPQSADKLIFELKDHPEWNFSGRVTADGRYLVVSIRQNGRLGNAITYFDLRDAKKPALDAKPVKLIDSFNANFSFVGNDGGTFYFLTNFNSPRGRVVAVELKAPAASEWKKIIGESQDIIDSVRLSAGRFVVTMMHDVASQVWVYDRKGKPLGEIKLPGLGAVSGIAGRVGDAEIFIGFSSFLFPGTILRHDLDSGKTETFYEAKVGFDASQYETRQVFYPSKGGVRVPLFLTFRKGLKLDGKNPVWLYGYGGFGVALRPQFAVPPLVWLERGGIYAVANLRGGGEYGDDWHKAGTKERKPNVFADFIAAADFLVMQNYTGYDRIALDGRSNGGLLVGAVINQRPDVCAVALPAVGVMDMLRYHKFTVGAGWASDYGNADTADGFSTLKNYSPLHNIKPGGKYPAVLVTTGDHDDRVFPAHSYKYAATLQALAGSSSDRPLLIHIESDAGHGGSSGTSPVSKTIEDWAYRMGFAAHYLLPEPAAK